MPLQNRQRIVHSTVLQGSPTTSVSVVESTVTTEESADLSKPKQKLKVKYLLSKFIYIDHPTHPVIEPSHSTVSMHSGFVKGRLRSCVAHWEKMGANPTVLDIIKHGYSIPFFSDPPPKKLFRNNMSAMTNKTFVDNAIVELVTTDRVVEITTPPYTINPLSVSKVGKNRD